MCVCVCVRGSCLFIVFTFRKLESMENCTFDILSGETAAGAPDMLDMLNSFMMMLPDAKKKKRRDAFQYQCFMGVL